MKNSHTTNEQLVTRLETLQQEVRRLKQEQKQAQDEAHRYHELLDFLEVLTNAIGQGEPADKVLAVFTERLRRTFHCSGTSVSLLSQDRQTLHMEHYAITGAFRSTIEKLAGTASLSAPSLPLDVFPHHKAALETCQPTIVHDLASVDNIIATVGKITGIPALIQKLLREGPGYIRQLLGINALLWLPLCVEEQAIGLLELTRSIPFTSTEIEALQTMVTAASALIHLKRREQQILMQSIALASAANAVMITDRKGNIVWVNPAFTRLTGYPEAEVLGRNPRILKSGRHDQAFYQTLWDTILASQVWHGEIINKRKDGAFYTGELTITPLENESGIITHFIAIAQDITPRKKLEAALQQQEQNFHDLVEHAPYGIVIIDKTGRFLFANHEVATLTGYTVAELLRLNSEILIPPEDLPKIRASRRQRFQGQLTLTHYEQKIVCKDGTMILVEFTITMTMWNDHLVELVIARDLTERQEMIANMQQRQTELALLNRVITAATHTDDPKSILAIACQELAHHFDIPQAAAALLNEAQTEEKVIAEYCDRGRPCAVGVVIPVEDNPATQFVIKHRRPLAIANVQSDPRMAPIHEVLRRRGTVSMLLLPLTNEDEVIGTIGLDCLRERHFSDLEIQLAANVAGAVAQAVARAQILQKEQQRRAELETLQKISLQITANLDIAKLLKAILAAAMQLTTTDDTHIFLYDGQRLYFGAALDRAGDMATPFADPRPDGITYRVARTGQSIVVPDVNHHPLFQNYRWGGAIASIPLSMGGHVNGVMNIAYNHGPHHFSEDELRVLSLLADQASVAIANAQAYEQANRRTAIQKALREVIVASVSATNLQEMLNTTLHTLLDALGLTIGAIWVGKKSVYSGVSVPPFPIITLVATAQHIYLRNPYVIADWKKITDPDLQTIKEVVQRYNIRASITVPIEGGNAHLGGISIADNKPHHWSDDEVELVESAGREVGTVAQRLQLLQEIKQEASQRQQIMESVDEGIILLGEAGLVHMCNGVGRAYLQWLCPPEIGMEQPATPTHLDRLGDRALSDLLVPPAQGSRHELQVNGRTFRIAANELTGRSLAGKWVLAIQDVTQEKEMQAQIQRQAQLAAVGQLAAGIAHDFNNIMSINILFAQLGMRTPGIPAKLQQRLQTILDQSKRATALIEQILDFSRSAVLDRSPLHLVPFLKGIMKILERTLPENIQLKMRYGEGEFIIDADPTRIQQVVMNLAINARDAMPQGGQLTFALSHVESLPAKLKPLQESKEIQSWVQLSISDSGTGMPESVLAHIFEPFFTTKPPGQGTGLGLAQVYGIVKQHDGEIDILSQVGRGTTFVIYLPASPPAKAVAPRDDDNLATGRGEVILIVEDNPGTREALCDSLEALNYQSIAARDGQEALAILAEQHDQISLILSDVIMPEMGGTELFRAVRQRYPGTKFVLLSGHPKDASLAEKEWHDLTAWLKKPVDLSQLAETLASVSSD